MVNVLPAPICCLIQGIQQVKENTSIKIYKLNILKNSLQVKLELSLQFMREVKEHHISLTSRNGKTIWDKKKLSTTTPKIFGMGLLDKEGGQGIEKEPIKT